MSSLQIDVERAKAFHRKQTPVFGERRYQTRQRESKAAARASLEQFAARKAELARQWRRSRTSPRVPRRPTEQSAAAKRDEERMAWLVGEMAAGRLPYPPPL